MSKKQLQRILVITLAFWLAVSCTPAPTQAPADTPVPTDAVEPVDAGVGDTGPGDAPETPAVASARYVPEPAICADLATGMAQDLNIQVGTSEVPFQDYVIQEEGTACRVEGSGDGTQFENLDGILKPLTAMMLHSGWYEDMRYGGGGAGGLIKGFYRPDGIRCLMVVSSEPSDMSLCPEDEPIFACWEILEPEQKIFKGTIDCARDTAAVAQPPLALQRIEVTPDGTPAQVVANVPAGSASRFVLAADAGPTMSVEVIAVSPESARESLTLSVWGDDGSTYMMGIAGADAWLVTLDATQNYTIDVISQAAEAAEVTLEVIIPAAQG